MEGGDGSGEATPTLLGGHCGHRAVENTWMEPCLRIELTALVPCIDFLKTKMNSEASKFIADFIVVGVFKNNLMK